MTTRTTLPDQADRTGDATDPTAALFAFVDARLADDLAAAEGRADRAAARYLTQSRAILVAMRADLLDDPRRADEVERYLCRTALLYREHPDFDGSWILLA